MNKETRLALRFVEELRKRNALGEVICEYGLENLRECEHCHHLMDEGWVYDGCSAYCSPSCLLHDHPEADMKEIGTDKSDTYWTRWV